MHVNRFFVIVYVKYSFKMKNWLSECQQMPTAFGQLIFGVNFDCGLKVCNKMGYYAVVLLVSII